MTNKFGRKVALITGGTSGIGRSAANKLAQLGIYVIVVGRNAERGEKTVAKSVRQGVKRILFRTTFGMRRVLAKWPDERSNSETAMLIF